MKVRDLRDNLDFYDDEVEIYCFNESGRLEPFSVDFEEGHVDEKMKLSSEGKEILVTFSAINR